MDEVISRKLISVSTDSEDEEFNQDTHSGRTKTSVPGMNGFALTDMTTLSVSNESRNDTVNASPVVSNVSLSSEGRASRDERGNNANVDNNRKQIKYNNASNTSPISEQDSAASSTNSPIARVNPVAGRDSPISGDDALNTAVSKTDSFSSPAATSRRLQTLDSGFANTTSSRQALLPHKNNID